MQHSLTFEQQARYFTLGEAGKKAWLVCHGYGQLASYFIRHFEPLAKNSYYVVAPEGLSRFYLQGSSGRVGASWMTKEERLTDIHNYLVYLDAVAEKSGLAQAEEINLLGFSQGAATICRWAMHTPLLFKKLVLWAGIFPPDVSPALSQKQLAGVKMYQVWGNQDPYLQAELLQQQTAYLETAGAASFESFQFQGAHQLHTPTLLEIASRP